MAKRLLIIDANPLTAENLRSRLASLGEVTLAPDLDQLTSALLQDWDLIVSDWSFGYLEGPALIERLLTHKRPVWLYSDRNDIVEGVAWQGLGVKKAFSRLQRAALVVAAEEFLGTSASASSSVAAPNFLLVEDSPTVRQFVKAILNDAYPGAEMIEADDGRTALAAMKSSRISLIITDLQMPGMDGLSFVQLLRNNAVLKKKPVVVLSGAVTDDARVLLGALDKVRVLAKPAKPADLLSAVRALLG